MSEEKQSLNKILDVENEIPPTKGIYPLITGYVEESTGHLYDRIEVEEMSGVEEALLIDKTIPLRERLDTMMMNVVKALHPSAEAKAKGAVPISGDRERAFGVQSLPSGESVTILVASRRLGHGDTYEFKEKCPNRNCQKVNKVTFDLKNLPVRRPKSKTERTFEVAIRSGQKFQFKVLTIGMDEQLEDLTKATNDKFTAQIFVRMIGQSEDVNFEYVKHMKSADRELMRKAIRDHEPSITTDTTVECDSCGTEWTSDMEVFSKGFFFPTEI